MRHAGTNNTNQIISESFQRKCSHVFSTLKFKSMQSAIQYKEFLSQMLFKRPAPSNATKHTYLFRWPSLGSWRRYVMTTVATDKIAAMTKTDLKDSAYASMTCSR